MEWSRRHSLIGNHPNYSRSKITWPLRIQMKKKGDLCPKYLENSPLLKVCVYAVSVMHTMQISILCLYLRTGAKYTICTVLLSCIILFRKNVSTANSSTFWFTAFSKKLFESMWISFWWWHKFCLTLWQFPDWHVLAWAASHPELKVELGRWGLEALSWSYRALDVPGCWHNVLLFLQKLSTRKQFNQQFSRIDKKDVFIIHLGLQIKLTFTRSMLRCWRCCMLRCLFWSGPDSGPPGLAIVF